MGQNMNEFAWGVTALTGAAAILLVVAGTKLVRNRETRPRGVLMIVAALVLIMNVMIWTV